MVNAGAVLVAGTSPPPKSESRVCCQPWISGSNSRLTLSAPCDATFVRAVAERATQFRLGKPVPPLVERQRAGVVARELGAVDRDGLGARLAIGVAGHAGSHFVPRRRGQTGLNGGG